MTLCPKCGREMDENQLTCDQCGYIKRYVNSNSNAGLYLNSVMMTYKQSGLSTTILYLFGGFVRVLLFPLTIKEKIAARFRRKNLIDYDAVGADSSSQKDVTFLNELEQIKSDVRVFIESTNSDIDKAYEESQEIKLQQLKLTIADKIVDKIRWLHNINASKLFKADYKILKQELILTLARLFETHQDIKLLEYSTNILEKDGILPPKSNIEIMKLTPMGRWL